MNFLSSEIFFRNIDFSPMHLQILSNDKRLGPSHHYWQAIAIAEISLHVHYGNSTDPDVICPWRSTFFYHIFETLVLKSMKYMG